MGSPWSVEDLVASILLLVLIALLMRLLLWAIGVLRR